MDALQVCVAFLRAIRPAISPRPSFDILCDSAEAPRFRLSLTQEFQWMIGAV